MQIRVQDGFLRAFLMDSRIAPRRVVYPTKYLLSPEAWSENTRECKKNVSIWFVPCVQRIKKAINIRIGVRLIRMRFHLSACQDDFLSGRAGVVWTRKSIVECEMYDLVIFLLLSSYCVVLRWYVWTDMHLSFVRSSERSVTKHFKLHRTNHRVDWTTAVKNPRCTIPFQFNATKIAKRKRHSLARCRNLWNSHLLQFLQTIKTAFPFHFHWILHGGKLRRSDY